VALAWSTDEVFAVRRDAFAPNGRPAKFIAMPSPMYPTFECNAIMESGTVVGISQWSCSSADAQALISLAPVDLAQAEVGT
jgi:hypothetical protein